MDSFLADLRYGIRMLVKKPGLSLIAVLTIAFGVGLTTHTFSIVYGSVIRGLDFDRGTLLVSLSEDVPSENSRGGGIAYLDLLDWREEQRAFRGLAAFANGVTVNHFEQVDGTPLMGRVFTDAEDDGSGEPVLIISHDVWRSRYAGAEDIIGRTVRANSETATIVGVMPEGFHFPFQADVWLPLDIDPTQATRGGSRIAVVGRLLEGVSLEQADVQMQAIAGRLASEYPETNEGVGVWVQSFEESVMPPGIVAILWVMLAAVFGVLLIACFNVANLLLARSTERSREMAIRSAMGAERGRIIRQLLIEATILAVVGGAGGMVLSYVGIEAFNASIVDVERPYWIDIRLDVPTLLFTVAITAFAAVAAGMLPAIRASGGQIHEILQDESRGSSGLRLGRFASVLVMGEIAMSCAVLVAAGMMIKSVINVSRYDMGFEPQGIFTARLGLFDNDYPDDESRLDFYDRLGEGLAAEPEAEAVGLTTSLPALGSGSIRVISRARTCRTSRRGTSRRWVSSWSTVGTSTNAIARAPSRRRSSTRASRRRTSDRTHRSVSGSERGRRAPGTRSWGSCPTSTWAAGSGASGATPCSRTSTSGPSLRRRGSAS
jgi:putative ABC transport system permease protein